MMVRLLASLLLLLAVSDGSASSTSECHYKPLIAQLFEYSMSAYEAGDDELYEEMSRLMAIERSQYVGFWEHLIQLEVPIAFNSADDPDTNLIKYLAAFHKSEIPAIRLLRWSAEAPRNLSAFSAMPHIHHAELDDAYLAWLSTVGDECQDFAMADYIALSEIRARLDGYYASAAAIGWFAAFCKCPIYLCEITRNDPGIKRWVANAIFHELYNCESIEDFFRILPEESHCCTKDLLIALGGIHSRCLDELVLENTVESSCLKSEH